MLTYLDHLETIHGKVHDQAVHIDLTQLLALPGVLQPADDEEQVVQKARPVLVDLLQRALERMDKMRVAEGAVLVADLMKQCDVIRDRIGLIEERAPGVIEDYHERLRGRIDALMDRAELKVDEQDLIREVAIFADRADVSEELSRTAGHLEQFRQVVESDDNEPVGRTMDFLAQELLREANTVASKSNDSVISRAIVEVKSAIDRMKEQVQNVE